MNKIYVAKLGKAVGLQGHLRLLLTLIFLSNLKGATFTTNRNLTLKVLEYNLDKELIRFEII